MQMGLKLELREVLNCFHIKTFRLNQFVAWIGAQIKQVCLSVGHSISVYVLVFALSSIKWAKWFTKDSDSIQGTDINRDQ